MASDSCSGPRLPAGAPDVVEVSDKHAVTIRVFTEGTSVLYSDHDPHRGEVRVRFFLPIQADV